MFASVGFLAILAGFLGLSPVTAALLGVVLLGEPASLRLVIGAPGVLAGLWIALRPVPLRRLAGPSKRQIEPVPSKRH